MSEKHSAADGSSCAAQPEDWTSLRFVGRGRRSESREISVAAISALGEVIGLDFGSDFIGADDA